MAAQDKERPAFVNSPELDELTRNFLRQGIKFASDFVKMAGLTGGTAEDVEARILVRCSETVSEAVIAQAEAHLGKL